MKNRSELAKHFRDLGFKKGAEIGVYLGFYSRLLLDTIPDLELLCVDSWRRSEQHKRAYFVVLEIMSKYPKATVIKKRSSDAVKLVPDESLDFVYIDADHRYHAVKEDINIWTPKVRKGGIVSGHDYIVGSPDTGVIPAVDEFVAEHGYKLELTDWDYKNPSTDDKKPSWYFTKT